MLYAPATKRDKVNEYLSAIVVDKRDFDGDALNAMLLLDDRIVEYMDGLQRHKTAFTFDRPFSVSSDLDLPKPSIALLNNWSNRAKKRNDVSTDKLRRMERYAA